MLANAQGGSDQRQRQLAHDTPRLTRLSEIGATVADQQHSHSKSSGTASAGFIQDGGRSSLGHLGHRLEHLEVVPPVRPTRTRSRFRSAGSPAPRRRPPPPGSRVLAERRSARAPTPARGPARRCARAFLGEGAAWPLPPSSPGLTRPSICLTKKMDPRVKPGGDACGMSRPMTHQRRTLQWQRKCWRPCGPVRARPRSANTRCRTSRRTPR